MTAIQTHLRLLIGLSVILYERTLGCDGLRRTRMYVPYVNGSVTDGSPVAVSLIVKSMWFH